MKELKVSYKQLDEDNSEEIHQLYKFLFDKLLSRESQKINIKPQLDKYCNTMYSYV